MTARQLISLAIILSVLLAMLVACGSPAPQPPAGPNAATLAPLPTAEKINVEVGPNEPQIFMLEPQDGAALDSPFFLHIGVSNFVIPIANLKIYVAIDATCTPAGQVIPEDAQHVSLPLGALTNPRFNLLPGQHRLCIQAANQDNLALEGPGMTRVIDVVIRSIHQPSYD